MESWDESFAQLERVLEAACKASENQEKDVVGSRFTSSSSSSSSLSPSPQHSSAPAVAPATGKDAKRKCEEEEDEDDSSNNFSNLKHKQSRSNSPCSQFSVDQSCNTRNSESVSNSWSVSSNAKNTHPDSDDFKSEATSTTQSAPKASSQTNAQPSGSKLKKDEKPTKKKKLTFERCNIRDIKLEEDLEAETVAAQKEEQERIKRLQETQYRALQERLIQIEKERAALAQVLSPHLFQSIPNQQQQQKLSFPPQLSTRFDLDNIVKPLPKATNEVILLDSSDEENAPQCPQIAIKQEVKTAADVIDISSSDDDDDDEDEDDDDDDEMNGNRVRKDQDVVMVASDEEGAQKDDDPNNSGSHTNDCFNQMDEEGRVLVNVGHPPEDPDIFLPNQIAKAAKPHQIGGIRFLYDNVVESLERYNTSGGFGCILAHSMGLGKTVQVISFVDVFLQYTPAKYVLCIAPINTIQNWRAEFDMWVPPKINLSEAQLASGEIKYRTYGVYLLNENFKTVSARASIIMDWRNKGGVLLMGYEMYRLLALKKVPKIPVKKRRGRKKEEPPPVPSPEDELKIKKHLDDMYAAIVNPGPDLVICDEGHRIKNCHASTSVALKSMKTRRRVVLTGYPLQNNLLEYWCMVDFVRPNYLGSRAEFCNMFERPISNGQCIDSTPRDRQLMRFRSHVLHGLLVGFVQRRGHTVLQSTLPSKDEHVLLIRMTSTQRKLYRSFVKDLLYVQQATNPLKLFAVCCKIWNHPDILYNLLQEKKVQEDIDLDIDLSAMPPGKSPPNSKVCNKKKKMKKSPPQQQSSSSVSIHSVSHPPVTNHPMPPPSISMQSASHPPVTNHPMPPPPVSMQPVPHSPMTNHPVPPPSISIQPVTRPPVSNHLIPPPPPSISIQPVPQPPVLNHPVLPPSVSIHPIPPPSVSIHPIPPPQVLGQHMPHSQHAPQQPPRPSLTIHPVLHHQHKGQPHMSSISGNTELIQNGGYVQDVGLAPIKDKDSSINYDWAYPILADYQPGLLHNSHKVAVLFAIIEQTVGAGDKLLVFSQSLSTLDLLEKFLGQREVPLRPGQVGGDANGPERWCKNKNYFRLDGSTSAQEREKLINEFNKKPAVGLFLLSTRAGCLGINLVGANRIVVMDASWNPCHDAQAVCRIYRYGQKKPCHIYRLVTDNSLEKRIYDRQVNKQGMSDRVIDEMTPESNFTWRDVTTLIHDNEEDTQIQNFCSAASLYNDPVLRYICMEMSDSLSKEPFEHESLLLDRKELKLTKQEKRLAKQSYEMAKRAHMVAASFSKNMYAAYYPAGMPNTRGNAWYPGPVLPSESTPVPMQPMGTANSTQIGSSSLPMSPQVLNSLCRQGVMVQKIIFQADISLPTHKSPPILIPAGQEVLVLRTPKGVYVRLPDGRITDVYLPPGLPGRVVCQWPPPQQQNGDAASQNPPRGQSFGIIKQTLQCGGTVSYHGSRGGATKRSQKPQTTSTPEVIDLSDDDEEGEEEDDKHDTSSSSVERTAQNRPVQPEIKAPAPPPSSLPPLQPLQQNLPQLSQQNLQHPQQSISQLPLGTWSLPQDTSFTPIHPPSSQLPQDTSFTPVHSSSQASQDTTFTPIHTSSSQLPQDTSFTPIHTSSSQLPKDTSFTPIQTSSQLPQDTSFTPIQQPPPSQLPQDTTFTPIQPQPPPPSQLPQDTTFTPIQPPPPPSQLPQDTTFTPIQPPPPPPPPPTSQLSQDTPFTSVQPTAPPPPPPSQLPQDTTFTPRQPPTPSSQLPQDTSFTPIQLPPPPSKLPQDTSFAPLQPLPPPPQLPQDTFSPVQPLPPPSAQLPQDTSFTSVPQPPPPTSQLSQEAFAPVHPPSSQIPRDAFTTLHPPSSQLPQDTTFTPVHPSSSQLPQETSFVPVHPPSSQLPQDASFMPLHPPPSSQLSQDTSFTPVHSLPPSHLPQDTSFTPIQPPPSSQSHPPPTSVALSSSSPSNQSSLSLGPNNLEHNPMDLQSSEASQNYPLSRPDISNLGSAENSVCSSSL